MVDLYGFPDLIYVDWIPKVNGSACLKSPAALTIGIKIATFLLYFDPCVSRKSCFGLRKKMNREGKRPFLRIHRVCFGTPGSAPDAVPPGSEYFAAVCQKKVSLPPPCVGRRRFRNP